MKQPRRHLIETFLVWMIIPITLVVFIQIPQKIVDFRQEKYETYKTIATLMSRFLEVEGAGEKDAVLIGSVTCPLIANYRDNSTSMAVWYSRDGRAWTDLAGSPVSDLTGVSLDKLIRTCNQNLDGLTEVGKHLGCIHVIQRANSVSGYLFVGERTDILEAEGWRRRADYLFFIAVLTVLVCLGYAVLRQDIARQVSSFQSELISARSQGVVPQQGEVRIGGELQEVFAFSKEILEENILVGNILHNLPVGLAVLDQSNNIILINRRMAGYVEANANCLVGKQVGGTPLAFLEEAAAPAAESARFSDAHPTPALVVGRQGKFVEVHSFPIIGKHGDSIGTLYIVLDSVDRGMMERLQLENGFFVESTSTGVVVIDNTNAIVSMNQFAASILAVEREQCLHTNWVDFGQKYVPQVLELTGCFPDPHVLKNRDVTLNLANSNLTIRLDSFLLGPAPKDQEPSALMLLLRDETEKHLLEEQARLADKLAVIGQMAASTAHEIRNPLTGIRGFVQLIERSLIKNGLTEQTEYIPLILAEIDRINEIIKEFLLLAKPTKVQKLFDLNQVIGECLVFVENEALLRDVQLVTAFGENLPPVKGDPDKFKQVVLNLARNSLEAISGGGRLTVRTWGEGRWLAMEVKDTGAGIPPELLPKMFEPFFTTKESGTGLGLPVTYKIVREFGGEINVDSEVGQGTSITVRLPVTGINPETEPGGESQ